MGAFVLTLFALQTTGQNFALVIQGYPPPDLQSRLTRNDLLTQLPTYTAQSRGIYFYQFAPIDFIFPLLGSLVSEAAFLFLVRRVFPAQAGWFEQAGYGLFFIPALFDWLENIANLLLIGRYPPLWEIVAQAALQFKFLKLSALYLLQMSVVALLSLWLLRLVAARFEPQRKG
jgi:hypothetical protein